LQELVAELEQAAGAPLRRLGSGAGEEQVLSVSELLRSGTTAAAPTTPGVRAMRTAVDPIQWRHRPLLFYALSQGAGRVASAYLMRSRGYARRREGELTYWYRPAAPLPDGARPPEPLVFIHGVGFGPAPYLSMVDRFAGGGAPSLGLTLTLTRSTTLTPTRTLN